MTIKIVNNFKIPPPQKKITQTKHQKSFSKFLKKSDKDKKNNINKRIRIKKYSKSQNVFKILKF